MESSRWRHDSLDWAQYAYQQLLEPRLNVKGRMAVVFLVAFLWAITWLGWRAWSVLNTPNDILVDKLGLDIPPPPVITLEEISSTEVAISWKHIEPSSSIQEYQIEIDGECRSKIKKSDNAVVISNLLPGNAHDIRVFSVSAGRFQTPSAPLHVRLPIASQTSTQDGSSDGSTSIRVIAARQSSSVPPPSAPAMAREQSGGHYVGRRGTAGRKPSPAGLEAQTQADNAGKRPDEQHDGDLVELSERFQRVQRDIEAAEAQIQDEVKDYERQLKETESKKDKLKQDLKKRDEESSDLRKRVHKAETQNRALLNDKTKKERELQQRENDRRKKRDEIAKWDEQISTMAEEMEGIETQKAAIQRRAQSDIREVRQKIEEERKEVAVLEAEIKDKQGQINALEEERKQFNVEDDTEETREADRLEFERQQRWKQRFSELHTSYTRVWNELQQASHLFGFSRDRLALYENVRRNTSITFAPPPAPLDLDAARRGVKPIRRPRQGGSMGSSISSPRGPYPGEPYHSTSQYGSGANASPTTYGPSFFNPSNGMTLMMPTDLPSSTAEENEQITSGPMSPRAEILLPADLLGDESSAEEGGDNVPMPADARSLDAGISPFPKVGSPTVPEPAETPSAGSSSGPSFSSPRDAFAPVPEADRRSLHSGQVSFDEGTIPEAEEAPSSSKKFMPMSLFSFGRQRGKTMADQGPLLGSLKSGQSHSFPRNIGDLDSASQPRRRLSYGGNWAFPGNLLQRSDPNSRRGFPSLMSFGKSSEASSSYDPFAPRNSSFDPGFRADNNSPRPSSTYSFDKMPRPSMESQFHAWNMDRPAMRNSPLAPDWGSLHSFSRSQSRRQSIHHGSASNLSLPQTEEVIVEPRREPRSLQAPIGTRPTSSQKQVSKVDDRPSTPKLNPAAPSFTSRFINRTKEKAKSKDKELEEDSPPESRKSKDAPSLVPTTSTAESYESLNRTTSQSSVTTPAPEKTTLMSRISRKASANKFGSWKDKSSIFSRRDTTTPTGEVEEDHTGSMEQLGKSLESASTTPSGEDRKASRTSLNWSFMRKSKKGVKDDLAASEVSESSERASVEDGAETPGEDDGQLHLDKYEYVRAFEREEHLLPNTWIVIRVDGRGFHKLSNHYGFTKPNDSRALGLMNAAAAHTLRTITDITFAYGVSDEFSFVFECDTKLFERRRDKLVSTVVSTFTAGYIFHWNEHFTSSSVEDDQETTCTPLDPAFLPTFDARAVTYPTTANLRDYLSWRQVDCHINNLYNTTFWALVQKGGRGTTEAEEELKGTVAANKNEILFTRFGINYNKVGEMERKGSVVFRDYRLRARSEDEAEGKGRVEVNADVGEDGAREAMEMSKTQREKMRKDKLKAKIVVEHVDIIKDDFWELRPWLLGGKGVR